MFLLVGSIIISSLCMEISTSDNFYDKTFYKTDGLYFVSKEAVNWTEAKLGCKKADLELASVISEEEKESLNTFITENKLVPKDKWSGYWLSGLYNADGKYYWDSTGTEVDNSIRGWAWGEPSHAYGREDCVELKYDQVRLGWNDYFCDETRRYICEVPRKIKLKVNQKKVLKPLIPTYKEWKNEANGKDDSTVVVKEGDDLIISERIIDTYPKLDNVAEKESVF